MIVHLVTDRRRLAGPNASTDEISNCLRAQVQFAVEAGVDVIQVRERDLGSRELAALASAIVASTRGTATRVVINDRADVALACGADGVHLRADSITPAAARRILPAGSLIGRSVHTVAEAAADTDGVDYLIAGTVWPTSSKPAGHPLLGVSGLRAIAAAARTPVLAIGGVTVARAVEVASTGAAGVAGIGLFQSAAEDRCRAVSLKQRIHLLRRSFDTL